MNRQGYFFKISETMTTVKPAAHEVAIAPAITNAAISTSLYYKFNHGLRIVKVNSENNHNEIHESSLKPSSLRL